MVFTALAIAAGFLLGVRVGFALAKKNVPLPPARAHSSLKQK
jgi:hypothetical protein